MVQQNLREFDRYAIYCFITAPKKQVFLYSIKSDISTINFVCLDKPVACRVMEVTMMSMTVMRRNLLLGTFACFQGNYGRSRKTFLMVPVKRWAHVNSSFLTSFSAQGSSFPRFWYNAREEAKLRGLSHTTSLAPISYAIQPYSFFFKALPVPLERWFRLSIKFGSRAS
jgi:hypothetical protein